MQRSLAQLNASVTSEPQILTLMFCIFIHYVLLPHTYQ